MSETIREPLKNENVYRGMLIEARDGVNWYMAKVLEHNKELEKVLIHFQGWNSKYDEWLPLNSSRIRHVLGKEVNVISPKVLSIGDNIITRWSSKFDYTPGKILRLNPDDKEGYAEVGFVDCTKKIVRNTAIKPLDAKFDLKGYIESLSEYLPTSIFDSLQPKEETKAKEPSDLLNNMNEDIENDVSSPSQLPFTDLAMIQEFYALSQSQIDPPNHTSNSRGSRKKRYAPLYHHSLSPDKTDISISLQNNESENVDDFSSKRTPRIRTKSKRLSSPIPLSTFQNFKAKRADAKQRGKESGKEYDFCDEVSNPVYTTGLREMIKVAPYHKPDPPRYYVPGIDVLEHNYLIGRPQANLIPFTAKASRSDVKPFVCRGGDSSQQPFQPQDSPLRRGKKRKNDHFIDPYASTTLSESQDSFVKIGKGAPKITTFNDEIVKYYCGQKGCNKDFRNAKLLQSHLTHFHGLDPTAAENASNNRTKGSKIHDDESHENHEPDVRSVKKETEFEEERISYLSTSSSSYGEQEDPEAKARRKQRFKRRKPKDSSDFSISTSINNTTSIEGGDGDEISCEESIDFNDKNVEATAETPHSDYDIATDLKRSVKRKKTRGTSISTTPASNNNSKRAAGMLTISTKSFFTRRKSKPEKPGPTVQKSVDLQTEAKVEAEKVKEERFDLTNKQPSADINLDASVNADTLSPGKNNDGAGCDPKNQTSLASALSEQNIKPVAIPIAHQASGQQKKKSFNLAKKRIQKPVWASTDAQDKQIRATGMLAETEEGIIHCPCGYNQENGLMIQCDLCLCWLHAQCVGYGNEATVPDRFVCNFCTNPKNASPKRLARSLNNDWANNGGRLACLEPSGPPIGLTTTNDQAIFKSSLALRRKVVGIGTGLRSLRTRINNCVKPQDLEKFNNLSLNELIAHLEFEEKSGAKKEEVSTIESNQILPITLPSVSGQTIEPIKEATPIDIEPTPESFNAAEAKCGPEENFNLFLLQEAASSTQPMEGGAIAPPNHPPENVGHLEGCSDGPDDLGRESIAKVDTTDPSKIVSSETITNSEEKATVSLPDILTNPDPSGSSKVVEKPNELELLVAEQNALEKQLDTLEKELQDLETNPYFMFDNPTDKTLASEYAWRDFEGPASYSYDNYGHYSNPYITTPTSSGSQPLLKRDLYVTRTQLDKVLTQLNSLVEGEDNSDPPTIQSKHHGSVKENESKKGCSSKATSNNTPSQNVRNNDQSFQSIIKATAT